MVVKRFVGETAGDQTYMKTLDHGAFLPLTLSSRRPYDLRALYVY